MRPSEKAWVALGVGVVGWNVTADDGELMSEAWDGWILAHPWLSRLVIVVFALHLANGIPDRYDLLHWVFLAARKRHTSLQQ